MKTMIVVFVLLSICLQIQAYTDYFNSRLSYQVSLYTKDDAGNLNDNFCSGNILQSHVILTAASCLFNDFEGAGVSDPIKLDNLFVIVSSVNDGNLIYPVSSIKIFHKFNLKTMEHNIALLNLSVSLPLSIRSDMQWITLADTPLNDKCINEDQINQWKNIVKHGSIRGQGLVCNSILVAILSYVNEEPSQTELSTELCGNSNFHYISILPYSSWIFENLGMEEIRDMHNKNYATSLPYREQQSAPIVDGYKNSGALRHATSFAKINYILYVILITNCWSF